MADIGNINMYNEYPEVQKYVVDIEIKAYRRIEISANSVEEAKIKASEEFGKDPWIDELHDWIAIAVIDGHTHETLWLKKGD